MITAITFQFAYNKSYKNAAFIPAGVYGERSTVELENAINEDIYFLQSVSKIMNALNADLNGANVTEVISQHLGGHTPSVRNITKTKRSYSIAGLTIHEEDK